MDELDKKVILRLLGDCRTSYRALARETGVTCPTIKSRVDSLIESGVIHSFTIDISQQTLGVSWIYAEIATSLSEDRTNLIQKVCAHPYTYEVFAVGSKRYIVFAESPHPEGSYEFGRFLRGLNGVSEVELYPVQQLPTSKLANRCKFSTRGKKVEFTNLQLKVMKHLMDDARIAIVDLADQLGLRPKRIRRVLKQLERSEGVHFTLRLNPGKGNCISFILKMNFDEGVMSPGDIVYWLEEEYPSEHWMSFLTLNKPILINYMTCQNLSDIEKLIRELEGTPFVRDVETRAIYHLERPAENGTSYENTEVLVSLGR